MKLQNLDIKIRANSLLESVIALSIISICIYMTVLIYATIYQKDTSSTFYQSRNKMQTMFFMLQINPDSVFNDTDGVKIIHEEYLNIDVKLVEMGYTDSIQTLTKRKYYINPK